MDDENAFQAHLDANPDDHFARLVFADWLEERGDIRAEGYRALGFLKLVCFADNGRPGGYDSGAPTNNFKRFEWWSRYSEDENPGSDPRCVLPWYDLLDGGWEYDSGDGETYSRDYLTRRDAADAAALAFAKLPAARRAQLLAGVAHASP